jgi:hypothetical protein
MKHYKRRFFAATVLLGLGAISYAGIYGWIQITAHQKARAVRAAYPQASSVAEALVLQIQSESESIQTRNSAVWIAGRLRIKEALPVMQSYCTGHDCSHETCLCQHELEKAIQRCGGKI